MLILICCFFPVQACQMTYGLDNGHSLHYHPTSTSVWIMSQPNTLPGIQILMSRMNKIPTCVLEYTEYQLPTERGSAQTKITIYVKVVIVSLSPIYLSIYLKIHTMRLDCTVS